MEKPKVTEEFLRTYKRALLLALLEQGVLNEAQYRQAAETLGVAEP